MDSIAKMNKKKTQSLHDVCLFIKTKLKIEWQYPVITEETVFLQQQKNINYLGLPWATIIDKNLYLDEILQVIKQNINLNNPSNHFITCCQHISYKKLIPLFIKIGIKKLYISHKIIGLDKLNQIELYPCPLYAVNIEDTTRNTHFKNIPNLLTHKRKFLYCFMGAYNPRWYLTNIRDKILKVKHPTSTFIKNTRSWHFENIVYGKQVQKWQFDKLEEMRNKVKLNIYNTVLASSRYSLCPSGSGPNSIRFWESLAFGSIPILLADTLELPPHALWDKAIVRIKEKNFHLLNSILSKIDIENENSMRKNCIQIYNDFKGKYF